MIEEAESLQKMQNMIQTKQYSKALEIALRLGRPGNAFDTLKLLSQDEIHSLVKKLSNTNKFKFAHLLAFLSLGLLSSIWMSATDFLISAIWPRREWISQLISSIACVISSFCELTRA